MDDKEREGPPKKKKSQVQKEKSLLRAKIAKGSLDIVDGLSKTNGLKSSRLLGTAGDISGKAAPWLEVGINVYGFKNGMVGPGEFTYDMIGTGSSVYIGGEVGTVFGGGAGFVAGAGIGLLFEGGKYITQQFLIPAYKSVEYKVLNPVTNHIKNANLRGYR